MSDRDQYNGWTNYETWNVKLWIDNDQGSYEYWRERTRESGGDVADLAQWLRDEHEDGMPEIDGTYADLLRGALSDVNWHEIAESMIEDARENGDLESEDADEEGTSDDA